MGAIAVLLLVHVPPDIPFVNVIVDPAHTEPGPPMIVGAKFTVTIIVAGHPPKV